MHTETKQKTGEETMLIARMIVMGIGALACILGFIFKLAARSPYTEQTQGTIVGMCMNAHSFNRGGSGNIRGLISSGSSHTGTRCPVFEYSVNGRVYKRANPVAYNCYKIQKMLGETRTVYYAPEAPEKASLVKNSVFGIMGTVFVSTGGAMILAGCLLMLF